MVSSRLKFQCHRNAMPARVAFITIETLIITDYILPPRDRALHGSVRNCATLKLCTALYPRKSDGPIGLDAKRTVYIDVFGRTHSEIHVRVRCREENKRVSFRVPRNQLRRRDATRRPFSTRSVYPSGTHRQSPHRRAFFFSECASDLLSTHGGPCDLRAAARKR